MAIEYFVSFCVMTKGGNAFGHSFLLLSQLDSRKPSASVEVMDAVGFYSRYLPILGYKPISPGRVKEEDPEFIARQSGLFHRTFQINGSELAALLNDTNEDRRIGVSEMPSFNRPLTPAKPGGPLFNLFKGQNCTNYVLKKLEKLGLPVSDIHSRFEIPRFSTTNLKPLSISSYYSVMRKKEIYCWDDLLLVTPRGTHANEERAQLSQAFFELQEGIKEIRVLLEKREDSLQSQGKKIAPVTLALKKVKALQKELNGIQLQPNRITQEGIEASFKSIRIIVSVYSASCPTRREGSFMLSLINCLENIYYKIKAALFGKSTLTKAFPCGQEETRLFQAISDITQRCSLSPG